MAGQLLVVAGWPAALKLVNSLVVNKLIAPLVNKPIAPAGCNKHLSSPGPIQHSCRYEIYALVARRNKAHPEAYPFFTSWWQVAMKLVAPSLVVIKPGKQYYP